MPTAHYGRSAVFALCLTLANVVNAQSSNWSTPAILTGSKTGVAIGWPSFVALGDTLVVAGTASPRSSRPDGSSFILLRNPGGVMPRPEGKFYFFLPKVSIEAGKRMHMLWGEPADTMIQAFGVPMIVSLWHASYERGRWSAPEKIFGIPGQWIAWEDQMQVAGIDSRGRLHVAFPGSLGGMPLMYARRNERRDWSVRQIAPLALYASITAWDRDMVAAAYVMPDTIRRPDSRQESSVLVTIVSRDGGETWSAPTRVPVPPAPLVRSPVINVRDGIVHLAWVMRATGRVGSGSIRHATMPVAEFVRGSSNWRISDETPLRAGAHLRFTFAVSQCGASMAAIETMVSTSASAVMPGLDEVQWPSPTSGDDSGVMSPMFKQFDAAISAGLLARGKGFDIVFASAGETPEKINLLTSHRDVCPSPRTAPTALR